jgi:uncharacterized protein with NRDE domain
MDELVSFPRSVDVGGVVGSNGDGSVCVVFLDYQAGRKTPLLLGANREESFRRPTTSPVCCRSGPFRCLLAGADHGPDGTFPEMGTWLGVNETGLIVAVTNRNDGELPWEEQVHSRGLLAVSLLGFDDPEQAARHAENKLSQGRFGGSNFLIASPKAGFIVHAPGAKRISVGAIDQGIHVITNLDLDDASDPRIRFVRDHLDTAQFVSSAQSICRNEMIIISGPDRGTVSSSQIIVGQEIVLHHLLGNPNRGAYHDFRLSRSRPVS